MLVALAISAVFAAFAYLTRAQGDLAQTFAVPAQIMAALTTVTLAVAAHKALRYNSQIVGEMSRTRKAQVQQPGSHLPEHFYMEAGGRRRITLKAPGIPGAPRSLRFEFTYDDIFGTPFRTTALIALNEADDTPTGRITDVRVTT